MRPVVEVAATDGAARAGRVVTGRGGFDIPCFMPVGTRGAVRHLSSADLSELGTAVVLANTYHLMLRPGADVVAGVGGLHRFMDWPGHVVTDSGGYQVFSLAPTVDDGGATFRSTYDGSTHRLTPEGAVAVQDALGADISMVLDVCPALPAPQPVLRAAVDRTADWAGRARAAFAAGADGRAARGIEQAQFGIVQGGTDLQLRAESAERTVALDFDGYAVGGLSVGEGSAERLPVLAAAVALLPVDRPRYLMGVGDPVGVVEAVGLGIDMFDCVLPTRHARHGSILTDAGKLSIGNAGFAGDPGPLDPSCACPVCPRWSRAYLRHLLKVGEPTGPRLLTIHNLFWLVGFLARLGESVREGRFAAFRTEVLATWGGGSAL